jgi:16S rRNA (cytidine1402-2'-O)-methyltransferase
MAHDGTTRKGTLFVVGTPIGNVEDLSPRAREVLQRVDAIAAEDTRRTRGLLSRIGVKSQVIAYHDHNERRVAPMIIERLLKGQDWALVSDAGMPLISDPGWALVSLAAENAIRVESVPGPCALTAALSVAGMPTDRFVFEGFLPRRAKAREAQLAELALEPRTIVCYEAVHRLAATLTAMREAWGASRRAVLVRELTKLHESVYRDTLGGLAVRLGVDIPLRGEFVLVVAGCEEAPAGEDANVRRVYALLAIELPPDRAVALTADLTGAPRNAVYRLTRLEGRDDAT